jgi:hypothetical protein
VATNEFRIKRATTPGTPSQPPADARPLQDGAPIVIYPDASAVNGLGYPVNTLGLPYADLARERSNDNTLVFWNALYPSSSGSSFVKVELLDPHSDTWKIYSGALERYRIMPNVIGGSSHPYLGFRVRISALAELAGWD